MKRNLLVSGLLLAASLMPAGVSAQTTDDFKVYDFSELLFDAGGAQSNLFGHFYHVSGNGKYAVGYDDTFVPMAYVWTADKPDDISLAWDEDDRRVSACDVANDGTVVGSWEDLKDGESTGVCYPAYRTPEGKWNILPVPEAYSENQAKNSDFVCEAAAITPDGRFIAGHVKIVTGYKETIFGISEVLATVPCLWENGELKAVYDDLGINTFIVWDISNDGSTIVGVNTAGCGGQNPAYIKDGKLYEIFDCGPEWDGSDETEDLTNFNGGVVNNIDAEGNMYGYFIEADDTQKYFMYTADGRLEYISSWVTCAGGGKQYVLSVPLAETLDCSEDGTVVVGGGVVSVGFGVADVPQVAISTNVGTGISRAATIKSHVDLDWRGGRLIVNGEYDRAEVYSASGALVAYGGQGRVLNMGNAADGTYVVRVTTADGVKSFKIVK